MSKLRIKPSIPMRTLLEMHRGRVFRVETGRRSYYVYLPEKGNRIQGTGESREFSSGVRPWDEYISGTTTILYYEVTDEVRRD